VKLLTDGMESGVREQFQTGDGQKEFR